MSRITHRNRQSRMARVENERRLLAQLRAGDEDAFELVVQRYGGRMLATARRFLNNECDAQDAVQEAFASAFRALDKFNGDAMLSTWLHRIVVNAALVQLRSKRRRGEQPIETLLPRFDQDGEWIDEQVTWTNAAETILERRDSRRDGAALYRATSREVPFRPRAARHRGAGYRRGCPVALGHREHQSKCGSIGLARHSRLSSSESLHSDRIIRTVLSHLIAIAPRHSCPLCGAIRRSLYAEAK